VRLIEVQFGGEWHRYLTNVVDPSVLSTKDVVDLYGYRWRIEIDQPQCPDSAEVFYASGTFRAFLSSIGSKPRVVPSVTSAAASSLHARRA